MNKMVTNIFDFTVKDAKGVDFPLSQFRGQPLLIVNTATKCGLAPQLEGLEELWRDYRDAGLVVIGFPCNQFLHQEPGDDTEITTACALNYGVSFPLMQKIDVNGQDAAPLFAWLREHSHSFLGGVFGDAIKWNYTKFLVHPDGRRVLRYAPTTEPNKLRKAIEAALA